MRIGRLAPPLAFLAGMMLTAAVAQATPEAATWRRQTLLGQNAACFFRYVATSVQPGSYYECSRTLRLEKVRKADLKVVESIPLQDVEYTQPSDSARWREASKPVRAFDLPAYLRANRVALAFPSDLARFRTFSIDSAGVWEVFDDGKVRLATRAEVERQIPGLDEDPRVVGIEQTDPIDSRDLYLRIESGSCEWDSDWFEDLLLIRGVELH